MKEFRAFYVAIFLLAGYLMLHRPAKEYMVIFFVIMLLPLIFRIILKTGAKDPDIRVDFDKDLKMEINLRHSSCVSRIRVMYVLKNYFTGEENNCLAELYQENESFCFRESVTHCHCGYLEASVKYIDCYDWLGISKVRFLTKNICGRYIYPELKKTEAGIFERKILQNKSLYGGPHVAADEISGVKEYVQGVPLKQIHWKLSAKMGKLYTKEYHLPEKEIPVLQICPENADDLEAALGKVMYLSQMFWDEGCIHWIEVPCQGELKMYLVEDFVSYSEILNQILYHPFDWNVLREQ